jgi:hypothetical protein
MHARLEQPALLDALRQAFARGDGPQGDRLLLTALESELPWDCVARTVAEGVALRYGARPGRAQAAAERGSERSARGARRGLRRLVPAGRARRGELAGLERLEGEA